MANAGWGKYDRFEGPFSRGRWALEDVVPSDGAQRRTLAVVAATEGAAYDAVNMYDRMIFSVGLIQFADAAPVFNACAVFQAVARRAPAALAPLLAHIAQRGYTFDVRTGRFVDKAGQLVNSVEAQRKLYLGGVSGELGSWTDTAAQTWALAWPSAVSAVFNAPEARAAQLDFAAGCVGNFVAGPARTFFQAPPPGVAPGLFGAVRAVFVSYAANIPAVASRQFSSVDHSDAWSSAWVERLLRSLAFGTGIAIYGDRYAKVRPVAERLFGAELPRLGIDPSVAEVQSTLTAAGFDAGKADGLWGPKSQAALTSFASSRGVPATLGPAAYLALGLA